MHELTVFMGAIGMGCLGHAVFLLGSPPFLKPGPMRPLQFHPFDPFRSIHLWTTGLTVFGISGLGLIALGDSLPIQFSAGLGAGVGYAVAALMQWLARRHVTEAQVTPVDSTLQ